MNARVRAAHIICIVSLAVSSLSATLVKELASKTFSLDKTVFVSPQAFYLGARLDASNTASFALVQAALSDPLRSSALDFTALAPEKVLVNVDASGKTQEEIDALKTSNPIYDNTIAQLAPFGASPVVVLGADASLGAQRKIALVNGISSVLTTTHRFIDAGGALSSRVAGIAIANNRIIAAITPSGNDAFGVADSGFSVAVTDTILAGAPHIVTTDATTGKAGDNKPVALNLAAGALLAINQTASVDNRVDMHFDTKLKRLFVGLRAHRSNTTAAGGIVGLLVGRIDASQSATPNRLLLEPVVDLTTAGGFTADSDDFIVTFRRTNVTDAYVSIYKVRTMHTSTGKAYMIVNGAVGTGGLNNKVFTLPIVSSTSASATTTADLGKVAKKTDFSVVVDAEAGMTRFNPADPSDSSNDLFARVGGDDLPINASDVVREMFVVGDAVFVCVSDSLDAEKSGVFKSTALFDSAGKIARWTPWQRAMGSVDGVMGGGFDAKTATFMYLTYDVTSTRVVKATQWGAGNSNGLLGGTLTNANVGLVAFLANEFPQVNGGVLGLFDFSNTTTSFKPHKTPNNLSVAVATGFNKVVLIETGCKEGAAAFTPTSGDIASHVLRGSGGNAPAGSAGSKAMVLTGGVLDTLGPISSAEIARSELSGSTSNGWLFVAGRKGLAVLSEANGDGWSTATNTGLRRGFVGITSSMTWKKVGSFTDVRRLIADESNLYIVTSDSLVRLPLLASNFSAAGAASAGGFTVATPSAVAGDTETTFFDGIVSSRMALLATSRGLFRVDNAGDIRTATTATAPGWTEATVTFDASPLSLGPVVSLDLLSTQSGSFAQGGNVYALASDSSRDVGTVFRFNLADTSGTNAITGSTFSPISEFGGQPFFFTFGEFKSYASTDGAFFFSQLSNHFSKRDFLKLTPMGVDISSVLSRGLFISLSPNSGSAHVGPMVRNSASGSLIVPGDFGIRVNE